MLEGSIVKGLLAISIPIMIMNVTQSLFNIIDMTVLKNFANDEFAVGSVGVCGTLISLITGLLIGCSSGANVVIARRIGRNDKEGSKKAVGTSISFAFLGGVFISAVGILGAKIFLKWMISSMMIISILMHLVIESLNLQSLVLKIVKQSSSYKMVL
jgi:Na+-driven multidrug efflux pump